MAALNEKKSAEEESDNRENEIEEMTVTAAKKAKWRQRNQPTTVAASASKAAA